MADRTITVTIPEDEARRLADHMRTTPCKAGESMSATYNAMTIALDALPPVMEEPQYPGAVVMTDDGIAVLSAPDAITRWRHLGVPFDWRYLRNPRPLTAAERAEHGIPAPLPEGHVAVRIPAAAHTAHGVRLVAGVVAKQVEGVAADILRAYADALEADRG